MSSELRPSLGSDARVCVDLGTAFSKASVFLGSDLPPTAAVAPLPIGAVAGAEHALLAPSALYVADGRIRFGAGALRAARAQLGSERDPILSFKMVLSAGELEPTLALKLPPSVDPSRTLCHGDALVLYLAYLDQLVRAAIALEPSIPVAAADAPRRLASPHWRTTENVISAVRPLVERAASVSRRLGAQLLDADGVDLSKAVTALGESVAPPSGAAFAGVVFEAQSAAAAYEAFACSQAPFLLVVDMGAGTTDFAGFERDPQSGSYALREIEASRQWCPLAGDELENIVIDLFMRAAGERDAKARNRLWRALRLAAQTVKQDIFVKGKAVFQHGRKRVTVHRKALENDASYRDFCRALSRTIAASLAPVVAAARHAGADSVSVLLAGGGSALPFLARLVRTAAGKSVKIVVEPFGANWTLPHYHHPFTGVFPQLAISMGGALARTAEGAPVMSSQLA